MILIGLLARALAADPGLDMDELAVSGEVRARPGPPLSIPADPHAGESPFQLSDPTLPYEERSYRAAKWLGVDVVFADRCRKAVELVYRRRYKEARLAFEQLDKDYPSVALGPVGLVLIYQALMFENLDYRYDAQYKVAFNQARSRLGVGVGQPGFDAPEWFLLAGMLGIDGIYQLRLGEHVAALGRAYEAIKALDHVREAAPDFIDASLGGGMYLYWRTVVATLSPLVPRFEDRRAEGIEKMKRVEREGVLLGPAATLALSYTYMEERRPDAALSSCNFAAKQYPDNLINLMTTGRVLDAMKRHDDALAVYARMLSIAPDNQRAHFLMGAAYAGKGDSAAAEREWTTYLAFPEVAPYYRGQTLNRLGLLYEQRGDVGTARSKWTEAVRLADNKDARRSLARTETR